MKVAIVGAGGIGFDVAELLSHPGPVLPRDRAPVAPSALDARSDALDRFRHEWGIDATYAQAGGVTAPQQETRQREEHRDRHVEPAQQPAADPGVLTGLERDVGDHHTHGGTRPQTLDSGQETPRPADPVVVHATSVPVGTPHDGRCGGLGC